MIEPSLGNSNHKQFFNNVAVLGLLGTGMHKLYRWDPQDNCREATARVAAAGRGCISKPFGAGCFNQQIAADSRKAISD